VAQITPVVKRHLAGVLGFGTWRHVYDRDVLAGPRAEAASVPLAAR